MNSLLRSERIVRKLNTILLLLLGLAVTACAGTQEPTASPAVPAGPSIVAPTDTLPVPPTAAATGPAAGGIIAAEPTPLPTAAAARPTPTVSPAPTRATDSPWPHLLREFDFGIPAGNSYNPLALAVHPGLNRLFVRTHILTSDYQGQGIVSVLDLDTGEVLSIAETGLDSYSEGQLAVDTGHDRVYVVNPGDRTCSILDATSLRPVATLQGVDRFALDAANGLLYLAGLSSLRVLDTASYDVVHEASLPSAPQFWALAVDAANGQVYSIYRDDSGYVLALYDAATLNAWATISLPGPPDDLLPDPERSRLYLTLNDGEHSFFWMLDSDGRLLEEQQLGDWTRHTRLALDSAGSRLFLGRDVYGDYGITVRDLETGQETANVPLDTSPNALAWDAENGWLLVSQTYRNQVAVVDVAPGLSCTRPGDCLIATFPTAVNLVDLAVDPRRDRFYVTDTASWLHFLDSESGDELALLPGEGRISVDGPHGRVYTGGEGASHVRIFDADRLWQTGEIHSAAIPVADAHDGGLYLVRNGIYIASLETMTTTGVISDTLPEYPGFSPNPAAIDAVVDPGSGRLFAIINNGVPGSNNGNYLYVYEPVTHQKVLTDTERSPVYLDIDPNTGRAYVSRIHLAGRSTSLLEDGRHYTARLDAVFGALRVDPDLGRVYLSDYGDREGYLLVLDAATLDVLGSVPIPGGFMLRALDPHRHWLYLATEEGKVQIWAATGGQLPSAVEPVPAELPLQEVRQLFLSSDGRTLFAGSLYRSEDAGQAWFRIGDGLPERGVQQVVVSPDYERDHTLFAVLLATDEGLGVWRSTDSGQSWRMADAGLSDLAVTGLAISPAFPGDGTLFATTRRQGLFRSTDGGTSWVSLAGRYHTPGTNPESPGAVVLSPTYALDRTVFVAHYGLQRSADGGETWTEVFSQKPESLAISPGFSADGTLFGWFGAGGLLRSTDGGETWSAASVGLSLLGYGTGRVILSPRYPSNQTLYFTWTPSSPGMPAQFFCSTDAAATWQRLDGAPPQGVTPVEMSPDGTAFLALDSSGHLARWPVDTLSWQSVALPPIDEITFDRLLLSPDFGRDRILLAVSEGAGILRSADAGLTWADTRFPLRVTFGQAPQPVILPPGEILVGTMLGLYRTAGSGPWVPAGGGLPQGTAVSGPAIGEDGSLRVLAGAGEDGQVFLSTDGGRSWTLEIPSLPAGATADNLLFSPDFAGDRTAFFAPSWGKPQRTIRGSEWEEFGPPGDWTAVALQISPAFDRDGLLFVRLDNNSLWRSADQGDTWTDVDGPWAGEAPTAVTIGMGYLLQAVTFSPAFAQDGVLLTRAGNTIYRSTDQGTAWTRVLDLEVGLSQAVFSPDYGRDGTVYLIQGSTLYRSTDRGQKWTKLPSAPWDPLGEIKVEVSPTFARDRTLLAWTLSGRVYESIDGGQSWNDASSGLAGTAIREVLFSPDHAADGLIFLLPYNAGLLKRVAGSAWLPVTSSAPQPGPTPLPTPTPRPASTATPSACQIDPRRFQSVWQQARAQLGCPQELAAQVLFAEQPFDHGRMFWDSSTKQIYVLLDIGTWQAYDDTFVENVDPAYDPNLPPPPRQPQRGFGKVWREQLGGPQAVIGWALAGEKPVNGWRQRFEYGLLVWSDAFPQDAPESGTAYLLYDNGTWQAMAAPAPK